VAEAFSDGSQRQIRRSPSPSRRTTR